MAFHLEGAVAESHVSADWEARAPGAPLVAGSSEQSPARVGTAAASRIEVRPIASRRQLEQMRRDRRQTYARLGVDLHDDALDLMRRFGTTLGLFVDGSLVGGFSCWRLSEALCSLGYAVQRLHLENFPPDRVVELGSMYVRPDLRGQGFARALMEAGRVLIAGMKPELLVAFAVEAVVDRYVNEFGFRRVGPPLKHPLAPAVTVHPLALSYPEFVKKHFA